MRSVTFTQSQGALIGGGWTIVCFFLNNSYFGTGCNSNKIRGRKNCFYVLFFFFFQANIYTLWRWGLSVRARLTNCCRCTGDFLFFSMCVTQFFSIPFFSLFFSSSEIPIYRELKDSLDVHEKIRINVVALFFCVDFYV